MAPKFVNSKAAAANERKAGAATAKAEAAARAAEEEKWKITDPKEIKMLEKKRAEEEKKAAEMARKAEKRDLEKEDESKFSNVKQTKQAAAASKKLTQAEIIARLAAAKKELEKEAKERELEGNFAQMLHNVDDDQLPVNLNHLAREEAERLAEEGIDNLVASGIDEALGAFAVTEEKRPNMKALYEAYSAEWMARLKGEGLKRSQMKEKIWKQWQKAPENPMKK